MDAPSIDDKNEILAMALGSGFSRARIAAPFSPDLRAAPPGWAGCGGEAALVVALPYGNIDPDPAPPAADTVLPRVRIDLFSRRNYYADAARRLQLIGATIRARRGGERGQYRVLCNSPIPEKPIAVSCGLGVRGRNSLIITPEAGSLVVIAALTLPFPLPGDGPLEDDPCARCAACVRACPTGALPGDGAVDRGRCLQQYLSHPGEAPPAVAEQWGDRLYGCSDCRDACPRNAAPVRPAATSLGALPEWFDADELIRSDDEELAARFKGTALGMGWCGADTIRRSARLGSGHAGGPGRTSGPDQA